MTGEPQMRMTFLLVGALTLAGCASITIPGRMYDMRDGTVLNASFIWKGDTQGPTTVAKPQEVCTGEYRTIVAGTTTLGTGIAGSSGWGSLFGSMYSVTTIEKAQRGFALATCPSGQTFECEYITNVHLTSVDGHGVCKDNRGATYRLMFG